MPLPPAVVLGTVPHYIFTLDSRQQEGILSQCRSDKDKDKPHSREAEWIYRISGYSL